MSAGQWERSGPAYVLRKILTLAKSAVWGPIRVEDNTRRVALKVVRESVCWDQGDAQPGKKAGAVFQQGKWSLGRGEGPSEDGGGTARSIGGPRPRRGGAERGQKRLSTIAFPKRLGCPGLTTGEFFGENPGGRFGSGRETFSTFSRARLKERTGPEKLSVLPSTDCDSGGQMGGLRDFAAGDDNPTCGHGETDIRGLVLPAPQRPPTCNPRSFRTNGTELFFTRRKKFETPRPQGGGEV